ncbi:MAG: DUF5663 domain-containing protein [Candidatus Moranbacteria bacterium]|nr:DUF5663 domain-containing protein [Candidatus Moranbacteria bacterium]
MDQLSDSQNPAVKQLIKELGIEKLPQDAQSDIIIKASEALLKRIFLETMEQLGEESRTQYEKMIIDGASPAQMEEFLKASIPNYEGVVQKVIDEFKEEIKGNL